MTDAFRSTNLDGTINEIELTPDQAGDLIAGKPITYTPHDARVLVDDDGQVVYRESAIPQRRDEAA